jgi:hypothetical protein
MMFFKMLTEIADIEIRLTVFFRCFHFSVDFPMALPSCFLIMEGMAGLYAGKKVGGFPSRLLPLYPQPERKKPF